jgi:hypothetical protein
MLFIKERCCEVHTSTRKHFPDAFRIYGYALPSQLFDFVPEYAIVGRATGLQLNEAVQLLVCADDNMMSENMKKDTATIYDVNKQTLMAYGTTCFKARHPNAGQNHSKRSYQNVINFAYANRH